MFYLNLNVLEFKLNIQFFFTIIIFFIFLLYPVPACTATAREEFKGTWGKKERGDL